MNTLQNSIIQTLAYFNIFNYPLTVAELFRYLWKPPANVALSQLQEVLSTMKQVEMYNGFVYLTDSQQITAARTKAYLESERKYKKRLPYIKLLTYVPNVQAIFIVNSLAYQNVREQSDIDLLIVSKPGKIWSTRFFTTTIAKLLGIRPRPNFTKDTLCLSFYLDGKSLDMSKLMGNRNDVYEVYWIKHLFPLYDPENTINQLQNANRWVKDYLPNAKSNHLHPLRTIHHSWLHSVIHIVLGIFSVESFWKKIQLAILPNKLKQLSGPVESSVVVLSDTLLKFHTHDPKPEWSKQWENTVKHYSR